MNFFQDYASPLLWPLFLFAGVKPILHMRVVLGLKVDLDIDVRSSLHFPDGR